MKVIHLISGGDDGGAKTHVHLLLKHLSRQIGVTLVCFMRGPFSEEAAEMGIQTVVLTGGLARTLGTLRRMIREGGYDIVHCHGSRGNLMGVLLKPFCRLPLITTVHSDPKLDYMGRPLARVTYGTLNAFALRHMDYLIGVSDSMRQLLISRGFPAGRIYTIYNGVEFAAAPEDQADRMAYYQAVGLDADERSVVVGAAARLNPVKDLPTLLRGFQKAWVRRPELRLLIAGEGPERERLERLAADLGIQAVVCFAGWQTDMPRFYRSIDINTLTSLSETFSYAMTEGARERKPMVSTAVGGIPDLVRNGETGILFTPGDDAALGEALVRLAEDPAERKRLGDALYAVAEEKFSAEASARTQLRIYQTVLRRKGRYGVLLCGAYGMRNAGDEAVLDAVLEEMRSIDPDMPVSVLSRDPADTLKNHGVPAIHSFHVLGFLREMRKAALYLNGGGSLVQDVTSSRSLWYYLFTIHAAKRRGCKVMMYGCGVGPVKRERNRRLAARVINGNVDAITLRDAHSRKVLEAMGIHVPKISVAAEPALSLSGLATAAQGDALLRERGLDPSEGWFCICIRRWPGVRQKAEIFARAADYAWKTYGLRCALLSVNLQQDIDSARRVMELVDTAPCVLVTDHMETAEVITFLSRMTAVMAMRLHALIFSAAQSVPMIGISYDPKVSAFLDDIRQPNYIGFDALTAPEQLYPMIDRAVNADREALREATERLKKQERRNTETARKLLEEVGPT